MQGLLRVVSQFLFRGFRSGVDGTPDGAKLLQGLRQLALVTGLSHVNDAAGT